MIRDFSESADKLTIDQDHTGKISIPKEISRPEGRNYK